jgi:hypothetical protein
MNNPILTDVTLNNNGLTNGINNFNLQKNNLNSPDRSNSTSPSNGAHILTTTDEPVIRDVWEDNFEEEFRNIMYLIEKYNVIGMVHFYSNSLLEIGLGYGISRHCLSCQ